MTGPRSNVLMRAARVAAAILLAVASVVQAARGPDRYLDRPNEWFASEEGRRVLTNVLSWQSSAGSWPKNQDNTARLYRGKPSEIQGTFDNGATKDEIQLLARAYNATRDESCRRAVLTAIDHLLAAQYPTGGWPQSFPFRPGSYSRYITFNDGAMVRVMEILRQVATAPEYGFVDSKRRAAAQKAFDRGIDCILKCQIRVNGKLTVWCAQHDEKDLRPRPARSYELVSLSGGESAGILRLLMSLENPSPEVRQAITAGAQWYESAKITGLRQLREGRSKRYIADTSAPPLWARFYEIETGRPMFSDRDGVRKYSVMEIGAERRNGYSWYGPWGESVAADYVAWSKKWLPPPDTAP